MSRRRGVLFMVLSALFFSAMALGVRLLKSHAPDIHVVEIVFFRSVLSVIGAALIMKRMGVSWKADHPWLLVFRGLFGLCGMTAYFVAIQELNLNPAVTIQQTNPLIAALLSWYFLGEMFGRKKVAWTLLAVGGIALITQPPVLGANASSSWNAFGTTAAVISAIVGGGAYTYVRWLSRKEHVMRIVSWFPLVTIFVMGFLLFAMPAIDPEWPIHYVTPANYVIWLELLLVAAGTLAGQIYLTRGLKILPTGLAMTVGMLQVPITLGYDVIFLGRAEEVFGTVEGLIQLVGILLVSLAVIKVLK